MIATRLRQLGMLLFSMLLCAVAFFQMFERTTNGFPQNYVWMLAFVSALFLTAWGLLLRFQPHADQSVMCCVLVLTGIGVTMIARLDQDTKTTVAFRQLLWLAIALVFANLLVVFMRDYRVLRRFSYVSMVIGIVLLLSPMLPVVGSEQYGARIWVKIPGLGSFQPSEIRQNCSWRSSSLRICSTIATSLPSAGKEDSRHPTATHQGYGTDHRGVDRVDGRAGRAA